ncbi:SusE domain-containing protein [Sediminibacterium soli]|uniref:SusE domain-containing protein n=1 Tax=Sediminibacterium soli TaxID=2698829 RepID=UPI00137A78F1|nr:SusE domain-containing protein [Sediminibacterium soli]NCI45247.1 hypothetical protein [Sediminibacterium soli]
MQKGTKTTGRKAIVISLVAMLYVLMGCSKNADLVMPAQAVKPEMPAAVGSPQLIASASRIALLQGNAKNMAARFNWSKFACPDNVIMSYTIEACVSGNAFTNSVAVANCAEGESVSVSVEELNDRLRSILITGAEARVDFRVRLNTKSNAAMYSYPVAMEVTTYQPFQDFEGKNIIRIPGNYQSWKVSQAPMMVSAKADREYEGYVNFSNAYAQFLLVKSVTTWEDGYTFTDIGAGKFGFNGKMFAVWEGAGIYKCNASTNTNKWTCTRIYNWSVTGSAAGNGDAEMDFDAATRTWSLTGNFAVGNFIFRANHADKIALGHNEADATGSVAYNAPAISIPVAGRYKIVLSLLNAGNYSYGVQRVS